MDINVFIGNKIKEMRNYKNITQEELGEYLGVTSQTVSRYESGKLKTNQDVLFKLADYFKVSINDFFPQVVSYINDEISDEMGSKNITNSQLSIMTGLSLDNIKNILSGENKLPNPSSLIKIANALENDESEDLEMTFFICAGYVEDPHDSENELYNTGLRYLLNESERKILCENVCSHWNINSKNHIFTFEEVYNTLFNDEKKDFSNTEIYKIIDHKPSFFEKIKDLLFVEIDESDDYVENVKGAIEKVGLLTDSQKNTIINMIDFYICQNKNQNK